MDDFEKLVQRCARDLENHTIFNASLDHAAVLFDNLLDVAEKRKEPVKIFSGCFEPSFYNHLLGKIKSVLAKGVEVCLISVCDGEALKLNDFVQQVAHHPMGRVKLLGKAVSFPHFILVGDRRYRVELDDALKSARANFNDPTTGATLQSFYQKLLHA